MRVKLFLKDRCEDIPVGRPGALPSFDVNSQDAVSAKIIREAGDQDGFYILQIGREPDIRAGALISENKPEYGFMAWDKQQRDWSKPAFKIFQGTIGESELYLVDSNEIFTLLAKVIVKNPNKEKLYTSMVTDLLKQGLPHFVVDDFRCQMRHNQFSIDWHDGAVSYASVEVMLGLLEQLVKRIKPLLTYINSSPKVSFSRSKRVMNISRLSSSFGKNVRNIKARMVKYGASEIDEVSDAKVMAFAKYGAFDIPAHSVIHTFLQNMVLRRLGDIGKKLSKDLNDYRNKRAKKINDFRKRHANSKSLKKPSEYAANMFADDLAMINPKFQRFS